jgi:hypothetical protein
MDQVPNIFPKGIRRRSWLNIRMGWKMAKFVGLKPKNLKCLTKFVKGYYGIYM